MHDIEDRLWRDRDRDRDRIGGVYLWNTTQNREHREQRTEHREANKVEEDFILFVCEKDDKHMYMYI